MSIIAKLDEILKKVIEIGYWKLPIPSDVDNDIAACIKSYQTLTSDMKTSFRKDVNNDLAKLLLYFSERMATLSLRTKDQGIFQIGLYALDAINGRIDIREMLVIISLYYDVHVKNKLTFDEIIKNKESIVEIVQSFLNRSEEDKSLLAMGYVVETNESKEVTYKRTW